jgi:hypothetical protein
MSSGQRLNGAALPLPTGHRLGYSGPVRGGTWAEALAISGMDGSGGPCRLSDDARFLDPP